MWEGGGGGGGSFLTEDGNLENLPSTEKCYHCCRGRFDLGLLFRVMRHVLTTLH